MVTLPLLKMPGTYFSAWGQREHELALSLVAEEGRCQQVQALRAAGLGQRTRHMGLSGARRECKPWLHLDAAATVGRPVFPPQGCEHPQQGPLWLELTQTGLLLFTTRKVLTNRRVMQPL